MGLDHLFIGFATFEDSAAGGCDCFCFGNDSSFGAEFGCGWVLEGLVVFVEEAGGCLEFDGVGALTVRGGPGVCWVDEGCFEDCSRPFVRWS